LPSGIQIPRFGLALQKLLGIQGHLGAQLVDDVFATLPLEAEGPELVALRGWKRWHAGGQTGASAGNFSFAAITPQADLLVVVEQLVITSLSGGVFLLGLRRSGGIAPTGYLLDARQESGLADPAQAADASPSVTVSTQAANTLALNGFRMIVSNVVPVVLDLGAVLAQCLKVQNAVFQLRVEAQGVNTDLCVGLIGRSRPIADAERSGF
jgi:hypothetical protein